MKNIHILMLLLALLFLTSCDQKTNALEVTATAYTSHAGQTDDTPTLAAWGDTLKPGMKAIAVSRDLIKMGLTHNTEVTIDGLDGTYLVLDKMNKRWTKKIDIYMGLDRKKAREWGKRKVIIRWDDRK
jgi:3D (Asp-Asp-Asp) domain-containing protein